MWERFFLSYNALSVTLTYQGRSVLLFCFITARSGDYRRAILTLFTLRWAGKNTSESGETQDNELLKDIDMLKRLKDINDLPEQDKQAILYNLDALLRDAKTRLAYK